MLSILKLTFGTGFSNLPVKDASKDKVPDLTSFLLIKQAVPPLQADLLIEAYPQ